MAKRFGFTHWFPSYPIETMWEQTANQPLDPTVVVTADSMISVWLSFQR
jgi:hypothetical protein